MIVTLCMKDNLRNIPRVEKTEVCKKGWNFAKCSCFASCNMKNIVLSWRKKTVFFVLIFTMKLSSAALSYLNAYSALNHTNHKSNIKGARFEFYQKQPLILTAAVERCSGNKLSGLHFYFTGVFEDLSYFFWPALKNLLKF